MRQLIAVLLFAFLAYASANSQVNAPLAGGPYDWNNFLLEVETTCKDVDLRREQIEKEVSSNPTAHANQALEVNQMLTRIILIQNMISYEFRYRDTLNQSQKNLLETYKNKALRLRQELMDLKKTLNN